MKLITIVLGIVISIQSVQAGNQAIRFKYLTINDGLSLSSVYCVHRDSKGFMWFGTEDGLNCFDGFNFKVYNSQKNNNNSICYKWIEHIYEDDDGKLWFASRSGLSCFNPVNENFTNYSSDAGLSNDTITCILQSLDTTMLVGTANGLNYINTSTNSVLNTTDKLGWINVLHQSGSDVWVGSSMGLFVIQSGVCTPVFKGVNVKALHLSKENLVAVGDNQLFIVDIKTHETISSYHFKLHPDLVIENILIDKKNRIWLGCNKGLYLFKKGMLKQIVQVNDVSNSLAINQSNSLIKDVYDNIWFGTHGDGVYYIQANGKIAHIRHNPVDASSLSQDAINCIYSDDVSGAVWLGTFGAGLNIYHPSANKFSLVKHDPLDENSLASDFVWSICEASDSTLWIGTNDEGISRYIPSSDRFVHYSVDDNSVRCIYEDSMGDIWVGTDGGGLKRFVLELNGFLEFENNHKLSDQSVRILYEDSKGLLWIGTRNGLNCFDKVSKEVRQYKYIVEDYNSLSHNFVYSAILEDKNGNLWVGTYGGGLNCLDKTSGKFERYTTESSSALSNDIVFALHEDEWGQLWIGTNDGLNVLNLETKKVRQYHEEDGLPNGVVYGILPDNYGCLWLSTNNGLCCFNMKTGCTRNYDASNGLQSNEFNGGAFHEGKTGNLYFGGVYGLNRFDPAQLMEEKTVYTPVFTGLEVMGKEVEVDDVSSMSSVHITEKRGSYRMSKSIAYADTIVLDYKDRFISIEFSGMNHLFAERTQYSFQLYPTDKYWNDLGNRNVVTYANMKPGKFHFRVKCANEAGEWSDEYSELYIIVKPPFWLTFWFMALVVLVFVAVVIFIHRYIVKIKTNKVLKQQNIKISDANRQLRVSESNLKQMNATKDKFFSIISHDLKNPFSSLMSISEMLTDNFSSYTLEDSKECVTKMNGSIKQIYVLLENLLTWSRSQRGKISFQDEDFDMSTLINVNVNLYRLAADKKEISFSLNLTDKAIAKGDRNTINTVVRNLMGNALKFTNNGGKITVSLLEKNSMWLVEIKDDGVGIAEENIEKLFCIDKKMKTDGTSGEKGTGLGLIICKEFVEKNKGEIGVNSKVNEGSVFWFTVPMN